MIKNPFRKVFGKFIKRKKEKLVTTEEQKKATDSVGKKIPKISKHLFFLHKVCLYIWNKLKHFFLAIIHWRPVSRLDRYIIAKFLGTYFFALLLIISIAVVIDFNNYSDRFLNNHVPMEKIIFEYYANFIPYFMGLFSSLFVFISVIFFTSKLAMNSEIIAMMSTGMSFKRMLRPYMISAAIISVLNLYLGAYVIPRGNEVRLNFEDKYKKKKSADFAQNIQLQVDNGVIAYMERYENYNKTGYNFSLDKFVNKKLVSHMTASSISYDTLSNQKYHWTINNYMIRDIKGMREKITRGVKIDSVIVMEPQDLLVSKGQQETMTTPELADYIEKQKERGFANIKEFEVEYHKRFATCFAAFILTTIGVSLSSRKRKGGMGLYLGLGLVLSFTYILFQTISATFAINADFPPMLAVWIPNIIFSIIAIIVYKKAPK